MYDAVALTVATPSWAATMQAMIDDEAIMQVIESMCTFPQHVSASKDVRDAATTADEKISAFNVRLANDSSRNRHAEPLHVSNVRAG